MLGVEHLSTSLDDQVWHTDEPPKKTSHEVNELRVLLHGNYTTIGRGLLREPRSKKPMGVYQQYSPGLRINEEGLQSSHAQIHNVRDAGVVVDSYGGSSMEVETRQLSRKPL